MQTPVIESSVPLSVHGLPVRRSSLIEVQSDGSRCFIILVDKLNGEWVTAWYRMGDYEWSTGHYFRDRLEAERDFLEREGRYLR
jgi:hypothetical protein